MAVFAHVDTMYPSLTTPSTLKLGRRLILASVGGALVFAMLSFVGDIHDLGGQLARFHWGWLVLAFSLATGNYAVRFVRWQMYLRHLDIHVARGPSATIFAAGFIMTVTPGKLGEVFKSVLLRERTGAPIARTAPIVIAERLTDLAALVLLAAAGALALDRGWTYAAVGAALVGFGLVTCGFRPAGELMLRLVGKLPVVRRVAPRLCEAYAALYALCRPALLLRATLLALGAWSLEVLALYAILLGLPTVVPSLLASTLAYAASTIAGAVALMPGGLGVTEAGMTGLLVALHEPNLPIAAAAAATILVRIATLWWAVVMGAIALAVYRRQGARLHWPNP